MEISTIYYLGIAASLYMAWNIGANDVANAMGTSVGSKALTLPQAIILAGIFEFTGSVLVGSHVTETIRKGIVDVSNFVGQPSFLAVAMFSALVAAGTWILGATYFGFPVSTTHAIVGAVAGVGLFSYGLKGVHWIKLVYIVLSWLISPVLGALLSFTLFTFIKRKIFSSSNPFKQTVKYFPFLSYTVFFVIILSIIYKGLKNLNLNFDFKEALLIAFAGAAVLSILGALIIHLKRFTSIDSETSYRETEKIFGALQILTACYVAFAHGANDVANAIGPVAAINSIFKEGTVAMKVSVPLWILSIGGGGIVLGLTMWGYRVMFTIGEKITHITPSRGFTAEISAATVILICSKLGIPISTTHTIIGAVIGVGFARGIAALDLKVIRNIVISWALELPVTIILSGTILTVLRFFFF